MKVVSTLPQSRRLLTSIPALPVDSDFPKDTVTLSPQARVPASPEAQRQAIKSLKTIQLLALSPALKAAAALALTCLGPAALAHVTSAPAVLAMADHLVHLGPWVIGFEAVRAAAEAVIPAIAIRDIKNTGHISPWVHKTSHVFSKAEKAVKQVTGALVYPFKAVNTWARKQFSTTGPSLTQP